jgi:hypothetical protein
MPSWHGAWLKHRYTLPFTFSVLNVHVPAEDESDDTKGSFYNQENVFSKFP